MTTKKHAATLLILMVVGLMGLANAQMATVVTAHVPFDFVANGKTFPAGDCLIRRVNNGRPVLMVSIGNERGWILAVEEVSLTSREAPALLFHRYGNHYFLAAIEGKSSYELPPSKAEQELQAKNVVTKELTILASAK
jgi:hypothetical protein